MQDRINKKEPQRILVTGGGGFLGGAIVRLLKQRGDAVRSFSRGFHSELETLGVDQIQGDIRDQKAVEQALKGMDLVFHVAAKAGIWGEYSDYYQTNVAGTRNVIAAGIKHKIPRLVYTSSPSVIFNGTDMEGVDESVPYPHRFHAHYPKTKALAEQLIVNAAVDGLLTIILRPHLIWGPRDTHLVPRIIQRAKRLKRVGNGKNLVDTIYIDNAAEAHVMAADCLETNPGLSGNIYFISQGQPVPVWDMINAILRAAGLDPVRRSISHQTAWLVGAFLEIVYKAFHLKGEPQMTRFLADELATDHWFDISAARRDLGYVPRITTEEGLRRLEHWLKTNKE
ncbi:MAG: NAD-dependent epimerase/dehydratase family protein [Pseudomonadota bacterium]|uniref:NAD-dependent epimerase/dehydratase family protein n=1 Tax=Candidatus Desulfatibia profunda TaxID=2841695 RepID=A0A8J6NVD7_9BACT|nr:NAD-dependent epimerase/dehydratase family protein [Candidatus Desulfatibia profunda]MBL7180037.1 NAD-dependent epimerase/dehydratase family protein [Desulfobacterales bacterium]